MFLVALDLQKDMQALSLASICWLETCFTCRMHGLVCDPLASYHSMIISASIHGQRPGPLEELACLLWHTTSHYQLTCTYMRAPSEVI